MAVFISAQQQNSSVVLKNVNSNRVDKIGDFNFNALASTLALLHVTTRYYADIYFWIVFVRWCDLVF